MDAFKNIALASMLAIGGLYAQDNFHTIKGINSGDYNINLKTTKELKIGQNDFKVKVLHKSHTHDDLKMELKIYSPDKSISIYKMPKIKKTGQYTFYIDLDKEGKYRYLLSFSYKGGVVHRVRGDLKL